MWVGLASSAGILIFLMPNALQTFTHPTEVCKITVSEKDFAEIQKNAQHDENEARPSDDFCELIGAEHTISQITYPSSVNPDAETAIAEKNGLLTLQEAQELLSSLPQYPQVESPGTYSVVRYVEASYWDQGTCFMVAGLAILPLICLWLIPAAIVRWGPGVFVKLRELFGDGGRALHAKYPFFLFGIIAFLLLTIAALPIRERSFYSVLRWAVSIAAGFQVIIAYRIKKYWWIYPGIAAVILFNPLAPFRLNKEVWVPIDLAAAGYLFASIWRLKRSAE